MLAVAIHQKISTRQSTFIGRSTLLLNHSSLARIGDGVTLTRLCSIPCDLCRSIARTWNQAQERNCCLWPQSSARQQISKSPIRSQLAEYRVHLQIHQPNIAFFIRLFQPFERLVLFIKARVDGCNSIGRDVTLALQILQVAKSFLRLSLST